MSKQTILIVDDEEDILELIQYNLTKEGYATLTALTGEQAIQAAAKAKPDLMVLDLMLPGMDGLEVTRYLKNSEKTRDIPIVMLTAKGEEADIVAGLELGASDYIAKPFSPKVLIARIRAVLRRGREKTDAADTMINEQGDMIIDKARHVVTIQGRALDLTLSDREAKNRSSELEAVHASMHEGVIALGKDERIITMNRAAAKILDFPGLKPEGRYVLEIARNVEFQQFLENALATHEPVEQEIVITRNRVQVLHIHSSVLYDTNRKRMGTLIIFHDITRLKTLETMQKDFAANVSHELKTPLTTIKGFIETVQQILHTKPPQESEKFLKIIEKNVNRMIDLINDLLALSRLERLQGTTVQFESQNISSLIGSAVTTLSQALLQKNITVNIACDQDLSAEVDPVLLQQAVINLVDNAVKYSFQGQSIDIEVTTQKDCLNIVVRDKGSGIAKEHQSKIFNRFYRVDKARSRHEGGTGLGLAIVKHIVQYHNGDITVQSRNNKGARFQITLPLFE